MPEFNILVRINCAECKHEMIKWDTGCDENLICCNNETCSLKYKLFEITGCEITLDNYLIDGYKKKDIPKEDAFKELIKKAKEIRRLGEKII